MANLHNLCQSKAGCQRNIEDYQQTVDTFMMQQNFASVQMMADLKENLKSLNIQRALTMAANTRAVMDTVEKLVKEERKRRRVTSEVIIFFYCYILRTFLVAY